MLGSTSVAIRPVERSGSVLDGVLCALRIAFHPIAEHRAHLSCRTEQGSSHRVQIGERELGGQRLAILEQPAIAHCGETELAFDDTERELDDCPQAGKPAIDVPLPFGQLMTRRFLERHAPDRPVIRVARQEIVFVVGVGLVAMHRVFLAVQQVIQYFVVRHFRLGEDQAVHQAAVGIGTDVSLHAEVPLIALFRRAHLRIALAFLVFGRWRRGNQRGIHYGAFLEQQPTGTELGVDLGEKSVGQLVALEQMAELADGGLVRDGVHRQVDPNEPAVQRHLVQRLFYRGIRVVEKVLQQVDAQQRFQRHTPPSTGSFGIVRRDRRQQALPGDDRVHLVEERFLARLLATLHQARIGKAELLHRFRLRLRWMSGEIFA